jgi:hypothetical protein
MTKFFFRVVLVQFGLDHSQKIAVIIGNDEPNWTLTPGTRLHKLVVPSTMLLILYIESHPGPSYI